HPPYRVEIEGSVREAFPDVFPAVFQARLARFCDDVPSLAAGAAQQVVGCRVASEVGGVAGRAGGARGGCVDRVGGNRRAGGGGIAPVRPSSTMCASLSSARGALVQRQRPPIMPRAMSTPDAKPQAASSGVPESIDAVREGLRGVGYLPGESTALVSFLATRL